MENKGKLYSSYFKFSQTDGWQNALCLCKFVVDYYEKTGLSFDCKPCYVEINTSLDAPHYINSAKQSSGHHVELTVSNFNLWNQMLFQLAHEITHCFIFCNNQSDAHSISWVEETICEAMSLFFLKLSSQNWSRLPLYKINPKYARQFITPYMENEIEKDAGADKLGSCASYDELLHIEMTSQSNREYRHDETVKLYELIKKNDIAGLIKYRDYALANKRLLDTEAYRMAFPNNDAVSYLCALQDSIMAREAERKKTG